MRPSLILIMLMLALNGIGQTTQQIVSKIEKVNQLMGSAVYFEGTRPKQYDNFEALQAKATKDELMQLTDHSNGVVRCYAFWALSFDSSVKLLPVVLKTGGLSRSPGKTPIFKKTGAERPLPNC